MRGGISRDEAHLYQIDYDDYILEQFKEPREAINKLLEEIDEEFDIVKVKKDMAKIHSKEVISVKEFKEKYGYSPEWQKNRRGRIHNSLPFIQTVEGGKITYNVKDVNIWFENENITT